jgi:polar amino acid transport system permease protein
MELFLQNFFNLDTLREGWPLLADGLAMTAKLVAVIVPLSVVGGLVVAVLQGLGSRWLSALLIVATDLLRAFPPLVLLILVYYGMPFVGLRLGEFAAATLTLVLNGASYYGEIFRAGIEAVPQGQRDAARSTGLGWLATMRFVVLPQAVRSVLPPLTTNTLELVKITSIAAAVSLPELLRAAQLLQGMVYNPTPLIAAALIYFVLLWPVVRLVSRMERQMIASHAARA